MESARLLADPAAWDAGSHRTQKFRPPIFLSSLRVQALMYDQVLLRGSSCPWPLVDLLTEDDLEREQTKCCIG